MSLPKQSPETLRGVATDIVRSHGAAILREQALTPEEARRRRDAAERDEIYSEGRQHRNLLPNRKT